MWGPAGGGFPRMRYKLLCMRFHTISYKAVHVQKRVWNKFNISYKELEVLSYEVISLYLYSLFKDKCLRVNHCEFCPLISVCLITSMLFWEETCCQEHTQTHILPPQPPSCVVCSLLSCPVSVSSQSQNKQEPAASLTHPPGKKCNGDRILFFIYMSHAYMYSRKHTTYLHIHTTWMHLNTNTQIPLTGR